MNNNFRFVYILLISSFSVFSQNELQLPVARFLSDSFKLGEQIKLNITYEHNPSKEVLFADSTYDFSPFEFVKKEFYPTKTIKNSSKDSVVYTLTTFELEPEISLSVPVFVFEDGDTTRLYSNEATIRFKEEITQVSQKDSLKVDTKFLALSSRFNYPYFGLGFLLITFIGLLIIVFYRKKIIAQYKLYFLGKDFKNFKSTFEKITSQYLLNPSVLSLEEQLSVWKKYMGKLDKRPYPSFTTKEIAKIINQNEITSSLQNYDRAIYGGYIKEEMTNSIKYLEECAKIKFENKQNELRNI